MEFEPMTLGSLARRPTVLIVLHQEHSTPGRVGVALKAMQVRLDIRRPSCGDPLPDTLADHDGVVVSMARRIPSEVAPQNSPVWRAGISRWLERRLHCWAAF